MSAILPGLCSITLRGHDVAAVIDSAAAAGLAAIEWGADVHVRPGDAAEAERAARLCADAGIECCSYGSYYFAGESDRTDLGAVLDTAEALGASCVRIWPPFGIGPAATTELGAVVEAVAAAATEAGGRGLRVALEFHPGTLTETAASTRRILDAVDAPNLFTYWQPAGPDDAHEHAEMRAVLDDLAHLHVFSWGPGGIAQRRPLAQRPGLWEAVLAEARAPGRWGLDRVAYLEYVTDDDPAAVVRDATTLRTWIEGAPGG